MSRIAEQTAAIILASTSIKSQQLDFSHRARRGMTKERERCFRPTADGRTASESPRTTGTAGRQPPGVLPRPRLLQHPSRRLRRLTTPPLRAREVDRAGALAHGSDSLPLLCKDPNRPINDRVDIVDTHLIATVTAESGSSETDGP